MCASQIPTALRKVAVGVLTNATYVSRAASAFNERNPEEQEKGGRRRKKERRGVEREETLWGKDRGEEVGNMGDGRESERENERARERDIERER